MILLAGLWFFLLPHYNQLIATDSSQELIAVPEENPIAVPDLTGHIIFDVYTQADGQIGTPVHAIDARSFSLVDNSNIKLYANRVLYGVDAAGPGTGVGVIREPETDRDVALDFDFATETYYEVSTPLSVNVRSVFKSGVRYIGDAINRALVAGGDSMDIGLWSIFIHNTETQTTRNIPNAVSPQFLPDDSGFLYLKSDGIYAYSFADNEERQIYDGVFNLAARDELAISANAQYAVLTQPFANLYTVYAIDANLNLTEIRNDFDEEQVFSSPLFHPVEDELFVMNAYQVNTPEVYELQFAAVNEPQLISILPQTVESLFLVNINDWVLFDPVSNL